MGRGLFFVARMMGGYGSGGVSGVCEVYHRHTDRSQSPSC